MKRYTVSWLDDAVNDLADCWLRAASPDEVAAASADIEAALADEPEQVSDHVAEGLRRHIRRPLCVYLAIDVSERRVDILR